jgi:hypothetical protein
MFVSLFTTAFLVIGLVHAGDQPLDFIFQANATTTPISPQSNCTEQQLLEEAYCGSQSPNSDHDSSHVPLPWTYSPQCLTDTTTDLEYCVYTSQSFHHNRGISLFVSPSIANVIEQSPAFQHPPSSKPNYTLPYEVRSIPGRGNGLFALRTLHRGEPILEDLPVGIFQSDAFFADYQRGYEYLSKTFEQLSEETRKRILRMAANREVDGVGEEVMERINTNAFAGEFGGSMCFLVYPETALMNHDCRPK